MKIQNIGTGRYKQTVETLQALIRMLKASADLKEQPDQGLHCWPFHLHLLDASQSWKPNCSILGQVR